MQKEKVFMKWGKLFHNEYSNYQHRTILDNNLPWISTLFHHIQPLISLSRVRNSQRACTCQKPGHPFLLVCDRSMKRERERESFSFCLHFPFAFIVGLRSWDFHGVVQQQLRLAIFAEGEKKITTLAIEPTQLEACPISSEWFVPRVL